MSNIKQHLEEQIVITRMDENTTGWKRHICLEYQGNEHKLILFWDEFNGYEIFWREPSKAPDWAIKWREEENEGASLAGYLDLLSWEKGE